RWTRGRRGALGIAAVVGAVALALRWQFAVDEHPPTLFLMHDMALYVERSQRAFGLARDAWDTFTPPGYPAFIALVGEERLGPVQALLGALVAAATALLGYRIDGSRWTAALAGLGAALYLI